MKFWQFVSRFKFYDKNCKELLAELTIHLKNTTPQHDLLTIATPNPEQLVQAWEQPEFAHILTSFDYLLPDGIGLVALSKVIDKKVSITEKISGVDVTEALLNEANKKHWSVLIIGGKQYKDKSIKPNENLDTEGDATQVIQAIKDYDQQKQIIEEHEIVKSGSNIYWLEGYHDFAAPKPAEEKLIGQVVRQLRPKLVFVAFGAPKQEFWIEQNKQMLARAGVKLVMAVGGTFDILTGALPRAPQLFRRMGLEWLWRLIQQPWRIKRQLRLIKFIWLSLFG